MNPSKLFGKSFSCICGKIHHIEPREVIYSDAAADRIPEVIERLTRGTRVAVLMDNRTRKVFEGEIAKELSKKAMQVHEVVVKDPEGGNWPICDDNTKDQIDKQLGDVDCILTIGSGVVTDLGKWLASDRVIPFIGFATAASMNGYASANVAPTIGGVKTLIRARPARAIFSCPKVLIEAPYEMTSAGLGDVLAKNVSTADWYMNHLLFDDYYCEKAAGLIAELEPLYLNHPEDIRDRKPKAIETLFQALLITGASMTMAETSSPASGGEHLISHALDMMSSMRSEQHDLHGRQVGVATVLTAELYRRVLSVESPAFHGPSESDDIGFWGPYKSTVQKYYMQKTPRIRSAKENLSKGSAWDAFREKISAIPHTPEKIHRCLSSASAATRAEDIRCTRLRLTEVFQHAHEIRSRFTILDLAHLLGLMPERAGEIIEEWA
ncbi:iron-containing alcohol dehydrogenase, partial [Thermodesulfobacteriota bacterium]